MMCTRIALALALPLAAAVPAPGGRRAGCDRCSQDADEYCTTFPEARVCAEDIVCPFFFDEATNQCWETGTAPVVVSAAAAEDAPRAPIIGGSGKFRYQYMPELLKAPPGASFGNCHGLSVDKDENIILTYSDAGKDTHCIATWNPDGTGGKLAGGPDLCTGMPHGLKITTEGDQQFLYHANNKQRLAKTTLEGDIIWIKNGFFGQNETCGPDMCPANSCNCAGGKAPYIPTWFATPPDSPYMYLCDGYGSDHVYAFERSTGTFMNKTWGAFLLSSLPLSYPHLPAHQASSAQLLALLSVPPLTP
jgi:hypothetical protein